MLFVCVIAVVGIGGCVFNRLGNCREVEDSIFGIQGPFLVEGDGSLTPLTGVARPGEEVVWRIDGADLGQGQICPLALTWSLQVFHPDGTQPVTTHRIPPRVRDAADGRCVVDNETFSYRFPAGPAGSSYQAEIGATLRNKLPDGVPPPGLTIAESLSESVYAHTPIGSTVTVETPAGGGGGGGGGGGEGGDGLFQPAETYDAGPRPTAVQLTELKPGTPPGGDEVAVTDIQSDTLKIFDPQSTGVLNTPPQSMTFVPGSDPQDLAAADLDQDGDNDLAVANFRAANGGAADEIEVLKNLGTNPSGGVDFGSSSIVTESGTISVAAGDLNQDIDASTGSLEFYPDLVAANRVSDTITFAMNAGDPAPGTFPTVAHVSSAGDGPSGVAIGDFNGDFLEDIAVANTLSDQVVVLRNTGPDPSADPLDPSATFTPEVVTAPSPGRRPQNVAVADLNGDLFDDIVVANEGTDNISVLRTTSGQDATDLTFAETTLPASPDASVEGPYDVTVGDFNGDGPLDIASANSGSNNASVFPGTIGGTSYGEPIHVSMGTRPQAISAGNLNNDGRADLATANFGDPAASPPATGGSLTVARPHSPSGPSATLRAGAEGFPLGIDRKGGKIKAKGVLVDDRLISYGKSAFDENGVLQIRDLTFSAELKAKANKDLPGALRRSLTGNIVGELDIDVLGDPEPPTIISGLFAGTAKGDPKTQICLKSRIDSRPGMENVNRFKLIGATGKASGLSAGGKFEPPTLADLSGSLPKQASLSFSAKQGKGKKLSKSCKALLKALPNS